MLFDIFYRFLARLYLASCFFLLARIHFGFLEVKTTNFIECLFSVLHKLVDQYYFIFDPLNPTPLP